MKKTIVLAGAFDTKGEEFLFVKKLIEAAGPSVLSVDFGVMEEPAFHPDISRTEVVAAAGGNMEELSSGHHKDKAMAVMARGLGVVIRRLYEEGRLDGILSMGGSGGTSIASAGMRALPVGVPKVMLSTVGGGDISDYEGTKDITFMPSVVDISGINRISRRLFTNAAGAILGMVGMKAVSPPSEAPLIAASMYGNTTPCVDRAREILETKGFEVLVFHATGTGGRAMEDLVTDGFTQGVLDITTTELADEVCGGVLSAGPYRCLAAARAGVPTVLAPGCIDMAVFRGVESMPAEYRKRNLYQWNPELTLMRTNIEENVKIGRMIAAAINGSRGPAAVVLPLKGVSMLDGIDTEGKAEIFRDPAADEACFETIRNDIRKDIPVLEMDNNINDPSFAEKCTELLLEMLGGKGVIS